ncbi:MAG: hypothetical protein LBD84_04695 [Campylobacteraceae bacterium]|nr:hypothetical protein [Campylobacteraceae bacterium]
MKPLTKSNIDDVLCNFQKYLLSFVDTAHKNPKPHYYLIIPSSDNEFAVVSLITSKIDTVKNRYKDSPEARNCLLKLDSSHINTLWKDSIIDANSVEIITKEALLKKDSIKYVENDGCIEICIFVSLITCIRNSPVISPKNKKKIEKHCVSVIKKLIK